jgi:hypothetical protein
MFRHKLALSAGFIATLLLLSALYAQAPVNRIDASFEKFWSAKIRDEAERVVDEVLKSNVTFDEAYRRLKTGRVYAAGEKTGIVKLSNRTKDGVEHFYALNVPANYDPAKRYQVRFQLHGGVGGRVRQSAARTGESPLQGAEQIYVVLICLNAAPWWSDDQVLESRNDRRLLKRTCQHR